MTLTNGSRPSSKPPGVQLMEINIAVKNSLNLVGVQKVAFTVE